MACRVLAKFQNFRYLMSGEHNIIQIFFFELAESIKQGKKEMLNMNHVAKLIMFYLQYEPELSLRYLLEFNIIFKLIYFFDQPTVQQLFSFLYNNKFEEISKDIQDHLWDYTAMSGLFYKIWQLQLYGDPKQLKKVQIFDEQKLTQQIQDIIKKLDNNNQNKVYQQKLSLAEKFDPYLIKEADIGFQVDIDNIKQYILQDRIKKLKKVVKERTFQEMKQVQEENKKRTSSGSFQKKINNKQEQQYLKNKIEIKKEYIQDMPLETIRQRADSDEKSPTKERVDQPLTPGKKTKGFNLMKVGSNSKQKKVNKLQSNKDISLFVLQKWKKDTDILSRDAKEYTSIIQSRQSKGQKQEEKLTHENLYKLKDFSSQKKKLASQIKKKQENELKRLEQQSEGTDQKVLEKSKQKLLKQHSFVPKKQKPSHFQKKFIRPK
ncbi:hypothetical protein PPERSA_12506 [Pseudocohnilembus persalinus]|uniref:Uncharacterized protein n=1 Tax=Pseudocohnilembus persalinus TaxID=266149 RepID=A0A0V0QP83_PSEPJ|nr:hypothetical protein PPERSA_12506 [Pseudocohnilembus persalinus]|eukprot:KRX04059.1 hypothetical protein PPERSA_12506 [Pseudocohnilembus persalinus]